MIDDSGIELDDEGLAVSHRVHKNWKSCDCSGYPVSAACNIKIELGYSSIVCSPNCPLEES